MRCLYDGCCAPFVLRSGSSLRWLYYGAPDGKPNFTVYEVLCRGTEPHLLACRHRVNMQCSGREVAGVVCES